MNGVVYVAYGQQARTEAALSIESLKQHADLPVTVIDETVFNEPGPGARWAKLNIDRLVEYDRVLYLDADTRVCDDLAAGFEMLDNWDLIIAPSKNQGTEVFRHIRSEEEREQTLAELGVWLPVQLQAGLMFFDRERCAALFEEWRKQWRRWCDQDQAALLRALYLCPVRVWLLSKQWNSENGIIVKHLFGHV